MYFQTDSSDNAVCALLNINELLGIRVTKSSLLETKQYPNYPSLKSISEKMTEL
jgi:hypothetical protein